MITGSNIGNCVAAKYCIEKIALIGTPLDKQSSQTIQNGRKLLRMPFTSKA